MFKNLGGLLYKFVIQFISKPFPMPSYSRILKVMNRNSLKQKFILYYRNIFFNHFENSCVGGLMEFIPQNAGSLPTKNFNPANRSGVFYFKPI